uniref:Uncharacterized protein n=1 Tax=Lepeophtheirus salmonis TaxID=72036 RepID=A0A0K2UVJ9_LEPSM
MQLFSGDVAITISIKYSESLFDITRAFIILYFLGHHGKELLKLNGTISICIHFIYHFLKLSFCGVLAQRSHHCGKLLKNNTKKNYPLLI